MVIRVSVWCNNTFTNTGGLDATIKKLFETNFIWADTNPNDEASFGTSTLCGTLLKEIAAEHTKTEEFIDLVKPKNILFMGLDAPKWLKIKFDPIKEGLEGMPFFKRIAFKQNQISVDDETGKKNKMIGFAFKAKDEDKVTRTLSSKRITICLFFINCLS